MIRNPARVECCYVNVHTNYLPHCLFHKKPFQHIHGGSSMWIKDQALDLDFTGWQEHHQQKMSVEELKELLHEAGVTFDEKYLP